MLVTSGLTLQKSEGNVNIEANQWWFLKLSTLWVEKIGGYVLKGSRSPAQVRLLYMAFQLFHENRLAAVLPAQLDAKKTVEEVVAFCETRIEDTGLPEDVVVFALEIGIRLRGELFRFWWEAEWSIGEKIRAHLVEHGYPFTFDPIAFGWTPTYLKNPAVVAAINASVATLCLPYADPWDPNPRMPRRRGMSYQEHFIGAMLASIFTQTTDPWGGESRRMNVARQVHREITEVYPMLHGAMYLPKGWTPPAEQCPEEVAFRALRADAEVLRGRWGFPRDLMCYSDIERLRGTPGEQNERKTALVAKLKEYGMSPYFFHLVVMECKWHVPYASFRGGVPVTTVQEFLRCSPRDICDNGALSYRDYRVRLLHWGLDFMPSDGQFDAIFG